MKRSVERRGADRISFSETNWILSILLDAGNKTLPPANQKLMRFEPKNISPLGLKLITNFKLPLFSEFSVSCIMRGDGRELLRALGKVVRIEEIDTGQSEKDFGIAIEFTEESVQKLQQNWPAVTSDS